MKPIITIIVPVYNAEKYLERCIGSLRNQTTQNIEIIIIDDGSTDNSYSIIENYKLKDSRINVVHTSNHGQGYAKNMGICASHGTYISFLDADDYYEVNTCESIVNAFNKYDADMVSFGYQIEGNNGVILRTPPMMDNYFSEAFKDKYSIHFFGDLPEDDNMVGVASTLTAFKASIIKSKGILFLSEKEYISEDAIFCLDYCQYAKSAVTIGKTLYHYYQNPISTSHIYNSNRINNIAKYSAKLTEYLNGGINCKEGQKRISYSCWVNYLSILKQINASFPVCLSYKKTRECLDIITRGTLISELKGINLPWKQRFLLLLIEKHQTVSVMAMVKLRNLRKYM